MGTTEIWMAIHSIVVGVAILFAGTWFRNVNKKLDEIVSETQCRERMGTFCFKNDKDHERLNSHVANHVHDEEGGVMFKGGSL